MGRENTGSEIAQEVNSAEGNIAEVKAEVAAEAADVEVGQVEEFEGNENTVEALDENMESGMSNLNKNLSEVQAELDSVGGEEGLNSMFEGLTEEQQETLKQSFPFRFSLLKYKLLGQLAIGGSSGALVMQIFNEIHNAPLFTEGLWGTKQLLIGAGIGAVVASYKMLDRLVSEYMNNKQIEKEINLGLNLPSHASHSGRKVLKNGKMGGSVYHPKTQREMEENSRTGSNAHSQSNHEYERYDNN